MVKSRSPRLIFLLSLLFKSAVEISNCLLFNRSQTKAEVERLLQPDPGHFQQTPVGRTFHGSSDLSGGIREKLSKGKSQKASWPEEIEKLLEVRCFRRSIQLMLHYDTSYSRFSPLVVEALKSGTLRAHGLKGLTLDGEDGECNGTIDEEEGSIVLKFGLTSCGTQLHRDSNDTLVYSTQVTFETIGQADSRKLLRHFKHTYPVRCVHPATSKTQVNETQTLELFPDGLTTAPLTLPHSLDVGGLLFLEAKPELLWYTGKDLYSFPVKCWTSSFTKESTMRDIRTFVDEGCPVNDKEGRGLSRIHHVFKGPMKVSLNLGRYMLSATGENTVYVHCDVIMCVHNFTNGLLNIPKCPISHYCAGDPSRTHVLPAYLQNFSQTSLVQGPLIVSTPDDHKAAEKRNEIRCHMACSQLIRSRQRALVPLEARQSHVSHVLVRGISVSATIAIALTSFVVGVFLMGGLWYLHVQTAPPQKLSTPWTITRFRKLLINTNQQHDDRNAPNASNARLMLNPL